MLLNYFGKNSFLFNHCFLGFLHILSNNSALFFGHFIFIYECDNLDWPSLFNFSCSGGYILQGWLVLIDSLCDALQNWAGLSDCGECGGGNVGGGSHGEDWLSWLGLVDDWLHDFLTNLFDLACSFILLNCNLHVGFLLLDD